MSQVIKVDGFLEMIDNYTKKNTTEKGKYSIKKRVREESLYGDLDYLELHPKRIKVDEMDNPRNILKIYCQKYHNTLSWWSLDQKSIFIRRQVVDQVISLPHFQKLGITYNQGHFYNVATNQEYCLFKHLDGFNINDFNFEDWQSIIFSAGENLGKIHSQSWLEVLEDLPLSSYSKLKELNDLELDSVFNLYAKTLRDMKYTGYLFPGMDNLRYQFNVLFDEFKFGTIPNVFVHGNFDLSNLLIDPNTKKVKAIINWDEAGYGSPFADWVNIYLSLSDYGLKDPLIMKWFFKGYLKYCHPSLKNIAENSEKLIALWARLRAYGMETINIWINNDSERKKKYDKWLILVGDD